MIALPRIQDIAAAKGDQPAVVQNDRPISWSEFNRDAVCATHYFLRLQAKLSIRTICAVCGNRYELVVVMAAAASLNITYCGLDYTLEGEVLLRLFSEIEADCLIVSGAFLEKFNLGGIARDAGERFIVDVDTPPWHDGDIEPSTPVLPSAGCPRRLIGFTSGTTGRPKPVLRTTSFDSRRFDFFTVRYGFSSRERHLVTLPFYHAASNGWARLFFGLGGTLVIGPASDPKAILELIQTQGITTLSVNAAVLDAMITLARGLPLAEDANCLKFMLVGGKNLPVTVKRDALRVFGPVVFEYYGTTETGVNTLAEPADLRDHPASVGRCLHGSKIIILNENRDPVPAGQLGTIAIASYMNMDRYIGAVAEYVEHEGEWYFLTPETGYLDRDSYLYLASRQRTEPAVNLYRIESSIRSIPAVIDVTVIATENAAVGCAIVLDTQCAPSLERVVSAISEICDREQLKLATCNVVPQIDYSLTGKVKTKVVFPAIPAPILLGARVSEGVL